MATRVTLSAPRPAPSFTPLFVAMDRGFLAEEGLEANIKYHVGVQGLLSGEIDFLGNDMGHVEFVKGADVRKVCGHSSRGGEHVLVVRAGIESVKDLKDVLVAGDENIIELKNILAHYGVDLEKSNIKTTFIDGSHPKQFEALQKGMGDGATLGTPWWIYAVKEGYKNMGSGNEFGPGLPTSGITVAAEKIAKHPEQVRGFVRAYVKTMKYCRENLDGTLDTMMKCCGEWGVDSREIAKMVYDIKGPYWSVDVDVDGVAKLLDLTSKKFGKAPVSVEKFLDLRFLKEAQRDLE
jgi:ABC-type nitrate/sulfonate/bicarbonate transport system substrate-binding protein